MQRQRGHVMQSVARYSRRMRDADRSETDRKGACPPALFAAYPRIAEHIDHVSLGTFPTALERIPGLLPGGCELWVKREDRAGVRYGGNKVRKLEFLLGHAQARGAQQLLTLGGVGSNHVLATALYGAALGMQVDAVLFPQPLEDPARPYIRQNLHAGLASGLRPHVCRSTGALPWTLPWAYLTLWRDAIRAGHRVQYIPGGGSNALGTLGWWSGGLEIAQQIAAGAAPPFDALYLALGSGSTTAGLLLGLGQACREVVAVRVVPWPLATRLAVQRLLVSARRYAARVLDARPPTTMVPALRIETGFLGSGYGFCTQASQQALQQAADRGLMLDPTYTAKAFAALWADDQAGRLRGKRVLFLHTYNGQPLATPEDATQALASLPRWLADPLNP